MSDEGITFLEKRVRQLNLLALIQAASLMGLAIIDTKVALVKLAEHVNRQEVRLDASKQDNQ
jgi:hypothetical protein